MTIIYSHEKPPIYERCVKEFGVDWDKGVIFTYGNTVYSKHELPEDLKAHEATHVKQQTEMGKDVWWDRYFADPKFRLEQEVEAYRNQMKYADENYNRITRRVIYKHVIKSMITMYGGMCTEDEAVKLMV